MRLYKTAADWTGDGTAALMDRDDFEYVRLAAVAAMAEHDLQEWKMNQAKQQAAVRRGQR